REKAQTERTLYYHRIGLAERDLSANNLGRVEQLLEECPADLRGGNGTTSNGCATRRLRLYAMTVWSCLWPSVRQGTTSPPAAEMGSSNCGTHTLACGFRRAFGQASIWLKAWHSAPMDSASHRLLRTGGSGSGT